MLGLTWLQDDSKGTNPDYNYNDLTRPSNYKVKQGICISCTLASEPAIDVRFVKLYSS